MPLLLLLPPTVSPLEIAWTMGAIVGMCVAALNCIAAYGDLRIQRANRRNGGIKITAEGELSDQLLILLALVCKFLMGALAMTALPGREPDGDPSLGSVFIPILMIIVAIALVYLSISKKIRRHKLDAYLLAGEEHAAAQLVAESNQRHAELSGSLDALHLEIADNTALTTHAAERANAAYHEANTLNTKIEATHQAGKAATEAGNQIMVTLGVVGVDTNERVKRVEDAVVQADAASELTDKRLDQLEARSQADASERNGERRRMVETGEDTNQRVRNVEDSLEHLHDDPA